MLRVDVSFDLVCPWCWIGKRNLEQALAQWAQDTPDVPVQVVWHGVQLLPQVTPDGLPFEAFYLDRLGSAQAVRERQAQVQEAAHRSGLDINFPAMQVMPNTARAHRLLELLLRNGLDAAHETLMERLFRAHFVEGRDIGSPTTLLALAQDCAVDANLAEGAVADARPIAHSAAHAHAGVPHFVFQRRWMLSGAHPPSGLLHAMREAHAELSTTP